MKDALAKKKMILVIIVLILCAFVLWQLIATSLSRSGKVMVTIDVLPKDSVVTANGKKIANTTTYLTPGNYTFIAAKDGFSNASVTMAVSKDNTYVGLTPAAVSDSAKQWLNSGNNALEQEGISSRMAESTAQAQAVKEPLLAKLPYQDPTGPFSIDVGTVSASDGGSIIYINNSTSAGRTRALQWIIDQGFSPVDYHIVFNDAPYPLATKDGD